MNSVGMSDKRPRDDEVLHFMVLDKVPKLLRIWYNNMTDYGQGEVYKHLGFLRSLLSVEPRRDVIESLVQFWDPSNNVFRFSDFELTPTLEEIGAFIRKGKNLRREEPMIPKHVTFERFFELLHIKEKNIGGCLENGWVRLEFLYEKYGQERGFELFRSELNNGECYRTWKKHSFEVFIVAFLGIMVFPKRGGKFSTNLAAFITAFEKNPKVTLVPMILADIYRALTMCKNGPDYFEGCNILLQLWMLEHDGGPKHSRRNRSLEGVLGGVDDGQDSVELSLVPLKRGDIYVYFPTLHRLNERVMRQFGRRQHIPPVEDMKEFMYEFLPDIPLRKTEILKIWGGCVLSGFDHMVEDRDKGEVDYWYLPWFHDQPPPKAMPERSAREPVDREAEIEVRIKQARREVEENYQSTPHVLNNDLERAKEELVHHEVRFEARIRLARKEIERENRVAMHALTSRVVVRGAYHLSNILLSALICSCHGK
ncbi:hypothetical protein P3S68_014995 [Capsicum galapagoense]